MTPYNEKTCDLLTFFLTEEVNFITFPESYIKQFRTGLCYFVECECKMMKKISHISLIFLLLAATTGMAVSKHYCGNSLISIVFFGEAEPCCDSGNCCHNETQFFQVDEDFSAPAFAQIPQTPELELFISVFESEFDSIDQNDEKSFFAEQKPPPLQKTQTILSLKQTWLL